MKNKKLTLLTSLILILTLIMVGCDDTRMPQNDMGLIISRIYIPNKGGDKFIAITNAGTQPINLKDYALKFNPALEIGEIFRLPSITLSAGKTLFCINGFGMGKSWESTFPTISANPLIETATNNTFSEDVCWKGIKAYYKTETASLIKYDGSGYKVIDTAPKMNRPCAYLRNINSQTFKDEGWFELTWDDKNHIKAIDTGKYNGKPSIPPVKPDSDTNTDKEPNHKPSNPNQTAPADNKALGLPMYDSTSTIDNYIVEKNEFIIGYNNTTHNPNWVMWHYNRADGRSTRGFSPEPLLPDTWVKVQDGDYDTPSMKDKYNRGHMCPNGDRSAMANETYTTANIIPQDEIVNRDQWADYETWMRQETLNGYEYYSIAGPSIESDGAFNGIASGLEIQIPSYMWRIGLIIDEKDGNDLARINNHETEYLKAIAVWMPNDCDKVKANWKDYIVTIKEIEEKTGLDFFSSLDDAIENQLENSVYQF